MASQSFTNLKNMTKSANIIKKVWLKKHPRNCPICMDLMGDRGFVDTPCKHKFCLECYTKLEDPRCPLCRSDIPFHNTSYNERGSTSGSAANDDDEFTQNPLIFIGNLIDNFTRDLQNYTHQDQDQHRNIPTPVPTQPAISEYGYMMISVQTVCIMIGLLIIALFSPYISLYVLILLFIMHLPNANHPASNLYESLLNIFPRQYQAPAIVTPTTQARGSTPPPRRGSTPPPRRTRTPPREPRRARTQTFGQIFEGFMHNQLSMTPMDRARPYISEGVRPSIHHNLHVNPYITEHFSDRRNNW